MRKPRAPSTSLRGAYDSELKALADEARLLKERRIHQLGELVVATGADVLAADALAGALLDVVTVTDPARQEGWRKRGAAFFHGKAKGSRVGADRERGAATPNDGASASA